MREETIQVNGVIVYLDDEVKNWVSSRLPYYRLRGKRVTEQQALEVIRCTDIFFSQYLKLCDFSDECIRSKNFNMNWFVLNLFPGKYGWMHPNGILD